MAKYCFTETICHVYIVIHTCQIPKKPRLNSMSAMICCLRRTVVKFVQAQERLMGVRMI